MSWDTMTHKEQLAAIHYDFYKDVHGIRPRWYNYDAMTVEELQAELDQLSKEAEVQAREEEIRQKKAIVHFEDQLNNLADSADAVTATRWLMDAADVQGDAGYFEYLNGLPYGFLKKQGYVTA